MSQLVFAIFILAVLAIAFYNRRKEKKVWLQEERYEESGNWLDKRAGERGTFGSLDEEMEDQRQTIARQARITDLAQAIRQYTLAHFDHLSAGNEQEMKAYIHFTRDKSTKILDVIGQVLSGKMPAAPVLQMSGNVHVQAVKKVILDVVFANYPALMDMEIDAIKQLDALAASWAEEQVSRCEQ